MNRERLLLVERLERISRLIGESIPLFDSASPDPAAAELKLLMAMNEINAELYPPPRYGKTTWNRINQAARMLNDGKSWDEIANAIGESAARDVRRRYKKELQYRLGHLYVEQMAKRAEEMRLTKANHE